MSLLNQVKKGRIRQPVLAVVFGPDGVGKSTLGAEAPNPVFLGTERGTYNLDVARLPAPNLFKDVLNLLDALTNDPHEYQTLVIDSLDWLEPLVWEQVVFDQNKSTIKSIEDIGYAKGYEYALDLWKQIISKLTSLRDKRQMHIVVIAHCMVKEAKDPTVTEDYNRYQLKLHHKAAALWREFVDMVLFANFETLTAKDKVGKVKAVGDGTRYLYTERRPSFDAKNRFALPFQIEMVKGQTWRNLTEAMDQPPPKEAEALVESIKSLIEGAHPQLREKVQEHLEKINGNVAGLEALRARVQEVVDKQTA